MQICVMPHYGSWDTVVNILGDLVHTQSTILLGCNKKNLHKNAKRLKKLERKPYLEIPFVFSLITQSELDNFG